MTSHPVPPRARLAGWLLLLGAVFLLVAALVRPNTESGDLAQISRIAQSPAQALASAGLFAVAGFLFFAAAVTIPALARGGRGSRLILVGAWLMALLGAYCLTARTIFMVLMHGVAVSDVPLEDAARAFEAATDSAGGLLLMPIFLGGLVAGPVVLALGLWRARLAPVWPAPMWFVGFLVYSAFEWTGLAREGIGWILMTGALAWLGVSVLQARSDGASDELPAAAS